MTDQHLVYHNTRDCWLKNMRFCSLRMQFQCPRSCTVILDVQASSVLRLVLVLIYLPASGLSYYERQLVHALLGLMAFANSVQTVLNSAVIACAACAVTPRYDVCTGEACSIDCCLIEHFLVGESGVLLLSPILCQLVAVR
jgi:hypothetical protein